MGTAVKGVIVKKTEAILDHNGTIVDPTLPLVQPLTVILTLTQLLLLTLDT